jgi:hypothetical protein
MRSYFVGPGLQALEKALIQVRQHTRKDGTVVRAHTRNVQSRSERHDMVAALSRRMAGGEHVRHATLASALGGARHASKANGKAAHVYEHADGGWVVTHDASHTEGHKERIVAVKGKARLHRAKGPSRSLAHLKGPIAEHTPKPFVPKVKPARPKKQPPAPVVAPLDAHGAKQRDRVLPPQRIALEERPTVLAARDMTARKVVIKFKGALPSLKTAEVLRARGFEPQPGDQVWLAPLSRRAVQLANYTRRRYNGLSPEEQAAWERWPELHPHERELLAAAPLPRIRERPKDYLVPNDLTERARAAGAAYGIDPQFWRKAQESPAWQRHLERRVAIAEAAIDPGQQEPDDTPHGLLLRAHRLALPVAQDLADAAVKLDHAALANLAGQVEAAERSAGVAPAWEPADDRNVRHEPVSPGELIQRAHRAGLTLPRESLQVLLAEKPDETAEALRRVKAAEAAQSGTGSFTATLRTPTGPVSHTFRPGQRVLYRTPWGRVEEATLQSIDLEKRRVGLVTWRGASVEAPILDITQPMYRVMPKDPPTGLPMAKALGLPPRARPVSSRLFARFLG